MSNGVVHGELTLFDCPRIRKSEYWQFIKLVAPSGSPPAGQTHWLSQDAGDAYCLKCSKMFRFMKGSSNSVRRHMERFHRKDLAKRQTQTSEGNKAPGSTKRAPRKGKQVSSEMEVAVDHSSLATIYSTPKRGVKRVRLDGAPIRGQLNSIDMLIKWLVLSMRPLSVVEDPGFATFAESLAGSEEPFAVPSLEALRHRIELISENVRFDVKHKVKKEVGNYALSIETWQAPVNGKLVDSHIALTCRYLREDFAIQSRILDVAPLASHSAEELRNRLLMSLQECGLQKNSLSLLLIPTHPKLEKAAQLAELGTVGDAAQNLERIVLRVLPQRVEGDEEVGVPSSALRAAQAACVVALDETLAAMRFCATEPASTKLATLHPSAATELTKLPTSPRSEWTISTTHEFVSRAVLLRVAVDAVIDTWELDGDDARAPIMVKPSNFSWSIVNGMIVLWRPLHEVLQVLSSEKDCSVPFIVPIISMVRQHFERTDLFEDLRQMYSDSLKGEELDQAVDFLQTLRKQASMALTGAFGDFCQKFAWVSTLDPRYGRLRHLADDEREHCKASLIDRAMELYVSQMPPATDNIGVIVPDFDSDIGLYGEARHQLPGLMHRLLYDEEEEVPTNEGISRDAEIAQTRLYVGNEVSMYLSEHQLRKVRISCPIHWWSTNRERYPFLAPLARIWLGTLACAPPSGPLVLPPPDRSSDSARGLESAAWTKTASDMILLHAQYKTASPGVSL